MRKYLRSIYGAAVTESYSVTVDASFVRRFGGNTEIIITINLWQ